MGAFSFLQSQALLIVKASVPVSIVGRPADAQPEVFHTVSVLRWAQAEVPYYAPLEIS